MEESQKYIYALDLSLNSTGICIFTKEGDFIKSLTIDTHKQKETQKKLKQIGDEFINLMKIYPPEKIIVEQGFTLYNKSTQAIYKVNGLVSYLFADYEQIYFTPTKVKKVIGGKGNMKKEEIQNAIMQKYPGLSFKSLDESDAYSVGETFFLESGIKE